jgi:uncharacterized protein (UPF0333 family)
MKQRCLQQLLGEKMLKFQAWSRNKRALSPIFATVLLAAIIIVVGSVAYFYASNVVTTSTNDYSSTITNSQQAIGERLAFENVVYNASSTNRLTVYIMNCGGSNGVKLNTAYLYDSKHNIVAVFSSQNANSISPLKSIDSPSATPSSSLNVGKECYFTLGKDTSGNTFTLSTSQIYTIHLITKSQGAFDYDFTP